MRVSIIKIDETSDLVCFFFRLGIMYYDLSPFCLNIHIFSNMMSLNL